MSGWVKLDISSKSDHFITSILHFKETITFLLFLLLLRLSKLLSRLRLIHLSSNFSSCNFIAASNLCCWIMNSRNNKSNPQLQQGESLCFFFFFFFLCVAINYFVPIMYWFDLFSLFFFFSSFLKRFSVFYLDSLHDWFS